MSDENVLDFYHSLGFEEADIEDGQTALFCELDAPGNYALLTDTEGAVPATLQQPVVFACYTTDGAFLWSVGFKDSNAFKAVWNDVGTPAQKLEAVRKYREGIAYYKNS